MDVYQRGGERGSEIGVAEIESGKATSSITRDVSKVWTAILNSVLGHPKMSGHCRKTDEPIIDKYKEYKKT